MAESGLASTPYCGLPALPGELAGRWNLDPLLLGALAAGALLYAFGARRSACRLRRGERLAFAAGWGVIGLVFVSPLCALGVSLFAAREAQHLLLALVAAPLVQLGQPAQALRALVGRGCAAGSARPAGPRSAAAAGILFAAALWLWHVPAAYGATFTSTATYWAMHLSVLASALALWSTLLGAHAPVSGALGVGTALHMGLLGALLCFAPTPLYAVHADSAGAWGLTALTDQQLAGLLCWIPSSAVLLAATLVSTSALLREPRSRAWT